MQRAGDLLVGLVPAPLRVPAPHEVHHDTGDHPVEGRDHGVRHDRHHQRTVELRRSPPPTPRHPVTIRSRHLRLHPTTVRGDAGGDDPGGRPSGAERRPAPVDVIQSVDPASRRDQPGGDADLGRDQSRRSCDRGDLRTNPDSTVTTSAATDRARPPATAQRPSCRRRARRRRSPSTPTSPSGRTTAPAGNSGSLLLACGRPHLQPTPAHATEAAATGPPTLGNGGHPGWPYAVDRPHDRDHDRCGSHSADCSPPTSRETATPSRRVERPVRIGSSNKEVTPCRTAH